MPITIRQLADEKFTTSEIVEETCGACGYDRMIHHHHKHAGVHMLECNNPECETSFEP